MILSFSDYNMKKERMRPCQYLVILDDIKHLFSCSIRGADGFASDFKISGLSLPFCFYKSKSLIQHFKKHDSKNLCLLRFWASFSK